MKCIVMKISSFILLFLFLNVSFATEGKPPDTFTAPRFTFQLNSLESAPMQTCEVKSILIQAL